MILTLKRFSKKAQVTRSYFGMGMMGGMGASFGGQKLDTFVDFPLEGLDMRPYLDADMSGNDEPILYDAIGVSNHFGNAGFGHYTAYAKNPQTDTWYNFDDSNCSKVFNLDKIVSSSAYSIFYRLREPN